MKKNLVAITIILIGLFASFFSLAGMQDCFDQLYTNLQQCSHLDDYGARDICNKAAYTVFKHCINDLTKQLNHPLFGAKIPSMVFYRSEGKPIENTEAFSIETAGTYYFNLYNGDKSEDNATKVSSAKIVLQQDIEIFSPKDFNKNAHFIVKPIYMEPGTYNLSVEIRSKPNSYVTIILCDRDLSTVID